MNYNIGHLHFFLTAKLAEYSLKVALLENSLDFRLKCVKKIVFLKDLNIDGGFSIIFDHYFLQCSSVYPILIGRLMLVNELIIIIITLNIRTGSPLVDGNFIRSKCWNSACINSTLLKATVQSLMRPMFSTIPEHPPIPTALDIGPFATNRRTDTEAEVTELKITLH